jgi:hypothetical protein
MRDVNKIDKQTITSCDSRYIESERRKRSLRNTNEQSESPRTLQSRYHPTHPQRVLVDIPRVHAAQTPRYSSENGSSSKNIGPERGQPNSWRTELIRLETFLWINSEHEEHTEDKFWRKVSTEVFRRQFSTKDITYVPWLDAHQEIQMKNMRLTDVFQLVTPSVERRSSSNPAPSHCARFRNTKRLQTYLCRNCLLQESYVYSDPLPLGC